MRLIVVLLSLLLFSCNTEIEYIPTRTLQFLDSLPYTNLSGKVDSGVLSNTIIDNPDSLYLSNNTEYFDSAYFAIDFDMDDIDLESSKCLQFIFYNTYVYDDYKNVMIKIIPFAKKWRQDILTPDILQSEGYLKDDKYVFYCDLDKKHEAGGVSSVAIDLTNIYKLLEYGFLVKLESKSSTNYITTDKYNQLTEVDLIEISSINTSRKYTPKIIKK